MIGGQEGAVRAVGSAERGWADGKLSPHDSAAQCGVRSECAGGGMFFLDRALVAGAVCSCGNPAWWSAAGFPTGVGRSGGGWAVVRSFPYPVRFHSRGGRPARLRVAACLVETRGRKVRRTRDVPGESRTVPRTSGGCRATLRGQIFQPPPPSARLRISSLANCGSLEAERNSWTQQNIEICACQLLRHGSKRCPHSQSWGQPAPAQPSSSLLPRMTAPRPGYHVARRREGSNSDAAGPPNFPPSHLPIVMPIRACGTCRLRPKANSTPWCSP